MLFNISDGFLHLRESNSITGIYFLSAIAGLEQFKDHIVTHSEVCASRLCNLIGKVTFDNLFTIRCRRNLQAQLKTGIAPNLLINLTCRLLRSKNQMNTQAATNASSTNQLFHEFRLFSSKFRKLINYDNEMGQWKRGKSGFIPFNVIVYIFYLVGMAIVVFFYDFLPTVQLCFYRRKGPC